METRPQHVSDDHLAITERNTSSKTSMNRDKIAESIAIDLIFEILLRLPVKSIARSRCLSKLWSSILLRPDFTDLLLTRSSARPQLLFACQTLCSSDELVFFSAPQLQNPDENSSPLVANYLMKIPHKFSSERLSPINGLVYFRDGQILEGSTNPTFVSVVYNPSTGQSLPLPKVITRRVIALKSYLGYDPIAKQFKVLSMTSSGYRGYASIGEEHQVLTLGTKKPSWRMIECSMPHSPMYNEICIDGVLYYRAAVNGFQKIVLVVCFDVRSEKFRFIKVTENFRRAVDVAATLINYNGKLGSLVLEEGTTIISSKSLELWVLEDLEKHQWSKHIHVLPPLWKNVVGEAGLHFVGVSGTNEIVLAPYYGHLCVFYFNIKRNTIVRVEI